MGAARVIDVRGEDFDQTPETFDGVFDTVGGQTLARTFPVLRRGGRLVTLQAPPAQDLAATYDVNAMFFVVRPQTATLTEVARLVDPGRLRVEIGRTFSLADGRAAFESGGTFERGPGKTVLVVH